MEITLSALRYFQKTAQLQHLSKAAEELHIAQPALSRTIHRLEQELGVPLFDRRGRGLILNNYGVILLKYANRIFLTLDNLQQEIYSAAQTKETTVTLSVYAASEIIPVLLKAFRKQNPGIRLQILQQDTAAADASKSDLTLFSSIMPVENTHYVTLLEEEIMLAVPLSDPRATMSSITLSSLSDENFISLQPGKNLRTITDFYCNMAGFTPQIGLECDSPGTAREFIRAGLGVSFVPSITWHSVAGENVALVPIESPRCRRYIGLMWPEGGYLTPAAKLLRDFLINHFAMYAVNGAQQ